MQSPGGAPYQVVAIPGKGRGMVATRVRSAGDTILQEMPMLVMPPGDTGMPAPLQSILFLHNALPNENKFSSDFDIPHHRLLDALMGVLESNSFEGSASYGKTGILLMVGSMSNHENNPNLTRVCNAEMQQETFTAKRNITQGEELTIFLYQGRCAASEVCHTINGPNISWRREWGKHWQDCMSFYTGESQDDT
jgi:hypothetical protein